MSLNLSEPLGRCERGCSRAGCKENRGARPPASRCKAQIKSNSPGGSAPSGRLIALRGAVGSVSHGGGEPRGRTIPNAGGRHVPSPLSAAGDSPEPRLLVGFRGSPGVWGGWRAGLRCCGTLTRGSAAVYLPPLPAGAPGLPGQTGEKRPLVSLRGQGPLAAAAGVPANTCT